MIKKLELNKDLVAEAEGKGLSITEVLTERRAQGDDSYDAEKAELDAFQEQMVAHNFSEDMTLDEVKQDKQKCILFVEFMNRALRSALEHRIKPRKGQFDILSDTGASIIYPEQVEKDANVAIGQPDNYLTLNDIVAIRKNVDSDVVKNAYVDMDKVAASRINRKRVVETGKFPTVQIASGSKTTNLYKYGRTVKISYEAQRRMQINELQLALNMIAFQWESDMIDDAANVLLTGASNSDVASMGTLAYTDMLNLDLNYDKPFAPTVYIANSTGLGKIFSISQFQDSRLFDTAKTGQWPAPFGRKLRRWDNTDLNKKLLTADARFALRQLTEKGSIIQEANKVIDGQWDAIAISLVRGWDLMFGGSRRTLTYSS